MFGFCKRKKGRDKIPAESMQVLTREEHIRMHGLKCVNCICLGCERSASCRCTICDDKVQSKFKCDSARLGH